MVVGPNHGQILGGERGKSSDAGRCKREVRQLEVRRLASSKTWELGSYIHDVGAPQPFVSDVL